MWWLDELHTLPPCPRCDTVRAGVNGTSRFLLDGERRSFLRLRRSRLTGEARLGLRRGSPGLQWEGQKITLRSCGVRRANLSSQSYADPEQGSNTPANVRRTSSAMESTGGARTIRAARSAGAVHQAA